VFEDYSDYAYRGIAEVEKRLPELLAPLPVEAIELRPVPSDTEAHILGTVVMGDDPADSVVDAGLVHHDVRNLLVLGGSAFPVGGPSNPTLTISALSMYAADRLRPGGST
jgi:choline dehydrogenase-like flavoprotein